MSFFERYFEALDGPDPHSSLELVADDVEFSIQWADGDDAQAAQFVGGRERAARASSTPATRAAGRTTSSGRRPTGDVEFALGETRWDDGAAASARSSPSRSSTPTGGWCATWSARSPAIAFDRPRRCAAD